jgi:hypothetical protein
MWNLEMQLASLYTDNTAPDLRSITSRVPALLLSQGLGTISRSLRVPNIDGIKLRGLYAMIEREFALQGFRGILYESNALVITDDHRIHGIIRIDKMHRIYTLEYSGSRQAYLALFVIRRSGR